MPFLALSRLCVCGGVCECVCAGLSLVGLLVTLWATAHQTLLSIGFSRQECWSGLPCPPPRGSSLPRDKICIAYIDRQVLYHRATWEAC